MLLGLLLCGILAGVLAAGASLVAGFSLWAAFGFYVLGGVLGICAGGLAILLRRRHRSAKPAAPPQQSPAEPKGMSPRG